MENVERVNHQNAHYWIEKLGLTKHPEGGYYREVYRADEQLPNASLPARYTDGRSVSTSIYFLLKAGEPSKFHRILSDELWHFYAGDAATIHSINDIGEYATQLIGSDWENGEAFVQVIPRNVWFGATVNKPDGFILVGCTVAPGFDFRDFELATRADLLSRFPQHAALVHALT